MQGGGKRQRRPSQVEIKVAVNFADNKRQSNVRYMNAATWNYSLQIKKKKNCCFLGFVFPKDLGS